MMQDDLCERPGCQQPWLRWGTDMGVPDQAVCFLAGSYGFLLGLVSINHKLTSLLKGNLSALCPLCSPFINSTGTLQASSYLSGMWTFRGIDHACHLGQMRKAYLHACDCPWWLMAANLISHHLQQLQGCIEFLDEGSICVLGHGHAFLGHPILYGRILLSHRVQRSSTLQSWPISRLPCSIYRLDAL